MVFLAYVALRLVIIRCICLKAALDCLKKKLNRYVVGYVLIHCMHLYLDAVSLLDT